MTDHTHSDDEGFEVFFRANEPLLRRSLVAGFGGDVGRDATSEAFSYAWEHWSKVSAMTNPSGYLYRVGENWAKRQLRRRPVPLLGPAAESETSYFEPRLPEALDTLTPRQRQVLVLVTGYGLTHAAVADLLSLSRSSIQNHLERGIKKMRADLGVLHEA